jgi:hypothetical protein
MKRDPHLPPPEVCDWLLEQEWSGVIPETFITYPRGGAEVIDSRRFDHCSARIEIGADERGHFELPIEVLEALKADQRARREVDGPGPDQPPSPRGGIVLNGEDTGSLLLEAILTLREIANLEQDGVNGRSWCRSRARAMLDRIQSVGEALP